MNCISCKSSDTSGQAVVICDRCTSALCQECASLTTTEMRSVVLRKRTIIFLCMQCRASYDEFAATASKSLDVALSAQCAAEIKAAEIKDVVAKVVSELLPDALEKIISDRITSTDSKIDDVRSVVESLRDSNIDLVRLFDRGIQQSKLPDPTAANVNRPRHKTSSGQLSLGVGASSRGMETSGVSGVRSKTPVTPLAPVDSRPFPVSVEKPAPNSISRSEGKKKRSASVIGTRSDYTADHSTFSSVERRQWLYIGRASPETTEDDITNYVKRTLQVEDARCHLLLANEDMTSFKLGVRESVLQRLLNPALWPQGIAVREFLPRSRNRTSGNFREVPSTSPLQ